MTYLLILKQMRVQYVRDRRADTLCGDWEREPGSDDA